MATIAAPDFYVLQKKLIVEMIMDVLSLDTQTVSDLGGTGLHCSLQQTEDVS